jgi:hypothetical protein
MAARSIPGVAGISLVDCPYVLGGLWTYWRPPGQDLAVPSGTMGRPAGSFHEE